LNSKSLFLEFSFSIVDSTPKGLFPPGPDGPDGPEGQLESAPIGTFLDDPSPYEFSLPQGTIFSYTESKNKSLK
jgi:hypothetical protein